MEMQCRPSFATLQKYEEMSLIIIKAREGVG